MRSLLVLALLVILLPATGCGKGGVVQPGDTVQPMFTAIPKWTAGKTENIRVRLIANSPEQGAIRKLGFGGIPEDSHPKATVVFFIGEAAQTPIELALSHRC